MKRIFKNKMLVLLVLAMVLTNIGSISYGEAAPKLKAVEELDLKTEMIFMENMIEFIDANYYHEVDKREIIDGALKGLFTNLDPYSNYYTKEEFEELSEDLAGDFGGIGVNITTDSGYIRVITPISGSPGHKAGILPKDIILTVDDVDVSGFSTRGVSKLIRGEAGTKVKLGILREGNSKPIYIEVKREIIQINPIEYEILKDKIGYIKISEFNNNTHKNLLDTLYEMDRMKVEDLIFDVRNNPGGSLNQVINALRLLVPKGPVVHIKSSNGDLQSYQSYNATPEYNIVTLINGGSASASEIFAAAVKERGAGTVIGTNSYGKSTVQTLVPLVNGGGLKITTGEYLTANKNSVYGVGVEPDIIVEDNLEKDLHLIKAIEVLKKSRK